MARAIPTRFIFLHAVFATAAAAGQMGTAGGRSETLVTAESSHNPLDQPAAVATDAEFTLQRLPALDSPPNETSQIDLTRLLRPRIKAFAQWEPAADGFTFASYELSLQMPVYPIFGPPPPMIKGSYGFTQVEAPAAANIPAGLHEFSLGFAWMRRINDKWMAQIMLSGVFASDLENTGSDAWQARLGAFALFRPSQRWTLAMGALATGRDDIPLIPAVGVVWQPSRRLRFNLMMPSPRASLLLVESNSRQHWCYLGGGISGGTWAIESAGGLADRVSYNQWRLVVGWESKRAQPPLTFRPVGISVYAEVGWLFGRRFEFENKSLEIPVGDGLVLRTGIRF